MITTTKEDQDIAVSFMTKLWNDDADGLRKLVLGRVDDEAGLYGSWEAFATEFLPRNTFPVPSEHKKHCYGWAPTLFNEGETLNKHTGEMKFGRWRQGEFCAGVMTLMYLDCDNDGPNAHVTFDEMKTVLEALGLQFLLYTSFSHTEAKHKVRAIIPMDRHVTYDEAYLIYVWFTDLLRYQLDGSIYNEGNFLYGPILTSRTHVALTGGVIDADAVLADLPNLPQTAIDLMEKRANRNDRKSNPLTPERWAEVQPQLVDLTVSETITIYNPAVFNPAWLPDFDSQYKGGSHRQSLFATLMRAWFKSDGKLTRGELTLLRDELDARQFNYARTKYGRIALDGDVRSIMLKPVTQLT